MGWGEAPHTAAHDTSKGKETTNWAPVRWGGLGWGAAPNSGQLEDCSTVHKECVQGRH